jgi:tetratricopeptide (TPR) repeat protein
LNNLAELYRIQGRYEEAEPLYIRVIRIAEEHSEATHPTMATSLNNLALLYEAQGRYEEAESFYLQAVTLLQAFLGIEHPQTQQFQMNYLTFLSDRYTNGDMDALLRLLRQEGQEDTTDRESS